MKNFIKFLIVLFLINPPILFAAAITITGVEGIVEVRLNPQENWKAAYTGMEVPQGSTLRTADRSRASIRFPNKSVIWLKENTDLAIKENEPRSNKLEMDYGSIKVRVPHIKRKEVFQVKSGPAVAAIRGTEVVLARYPGADVVAKNRIELDKVKNELDRLPPGDPEIDRIRTDLNIKRDAFQKFDDKFGHVPKETLTGTPIIHCLFGEVNLNWISDTGKVVYDRTIAQGTGVSDIKTDIRGNVVMADVKLLTPEEEKKGLELWGTGLTEMQRGFPLESTRAEKSKMREYAAGVDAQYREIMGQSGQIKEEDFAAGRTLTDVHGNLVRVDQRLERTSNSIQVVNVVKRTGYLSGGLRGAVYNGSSESRIDALIANVTFNKDLPDNINELGGFFASHDEVKPEKVRAVAVNMTDTGSVFVIGFFGLRDANSTLDDVRSDLYIGTLTTSGGKTGKEKLFTLDIATDKSVTGLTRFVEDTETGSKISTVEGVGGELYSRDAKRWREYGATPTDNTKKLWLVTENFFINNSGKTKNISDLTNASSNFDSLFKDTAVEVAFFAKQADATTGNIVTNSSGRYSSDAVNFLGSNSKNKNVDLVIIPDIGFSFLKALGPQGFSEGSSVQK